MADTKPTDVNTSTSERQHFLGVGAPATGNTGDTGLRLAPKPPASSQTEKP